MNNQILDGILAIRNNIKHDGWLILPPSSNSDELRLRAEWFIDGGRYSFEHRFTAVDLKFATANLAEIYVEMANESIELRIKSIKGK